MRNGLRIVLASVECKWDLTWAVESRTDSSTYDSQARDPSSWKAPRKEALFPIVVAKPPVQQPCKLALEGSTRDH